MPGFVSPPSSPSPDDVAARPGGGAEGRGPLLVFLLMAGSCLPILGAVLLAPVLPKMQDHFEDVAGAKALVPIVLSAPAFALALLAPFAGVIIDRLGRKRLLVVGAVLYSVFGTAPLWLDSLGAIVASRALVGVCEAAIMTCCTTLIGDYYTGRTRDRYLALQTVCGTASATAFFVIGGAMGSAGWRAPFWLYAVGLLLAPAMAAFLPRPTPKDASVAHEVAADEPRPFPWRKMAGICALSVFGGIVFYTVPVETAYLLDDLGVESSGVIGLATALASAATVAGCLVFTRLTGRPEQRLPVVLALCATGFVVMALAGTPVVLIVGAVLNCVGTGLLLPSLLTSGMNRLDYADRGRGTGLWTAAFFLGQFLCPLVLIAAGSAVGGLATAVGVLALVTAVVAAGLWLATRGTAQVAESPQV
ncbi:MFS transporter [Streptomyces sp. YKOK-I1]